MIEGTTQSGFHFQVEEAALDDFELLEALVAVQEGRATGFVAVTEKLLGKTGKKALTEHLRNEQGRVSAKLVYGEITEIFQMIGNREKNSVS